MAMTTRNVWYNQTMGKEVYIVDHVAENLPFDDYKGSIIEYCKMRGYIQSDEDNRGESDSNDE